MLGLIAVEVGNGHTMIFTAEVMVNYVALISCITK